MTVNGLSPQELKLTTDIAYLDLGLLEQIMDYKTGGPYTIAELLSYNNDGNEISQEYLDNLIRDLEVEKSVVSLSSAKINQLIQYNSNNNNNNPLNWKIIDTYDRNNEGQSGFYGVVIDTGEGIVVSFRGSESPTLLQNIHQDWIKADLALIAGRLTDQQKDVESFLDQLKEDGFFKKFDNITFAGHSLGGNLAEHATFYAAELGVIDKVSNTISYDGPGFSRGYLESHKEYIELATKNVNMLHVEQSFIGGLLERPDGVNHFYADLIGEGPVQHGTENVHFDSKGNIVEGKQTWLSKVITPFSQGMDRLIGPVESAVLVHGLIGLTTLGWAIKDKLVNEKGELTTAGKILVTTVGISLTAAVIVLGPIGTVAVTLALAKMAVAILAVVVLAIAAVIVFDFVMDIVEAVADYVTQVLIPQMLEALASTVASMLNWSRERGAEFLNMLQTGFTAIFSGLRNLFGSRSQAVATPYIKVDTYKLRRYAERLESIKGRISTIDSKLNALYFSEGLLDIIHLAIAQQLPSKRKINRCIDYLHETANDFEKTEQKIMNM
ncbi:Mbeg1-like protein [Sutcliffiella cohnii]